MFNFLTHEENVIEERPKAEKKVAKKKWDRDWSLSYPAKNNEITSYINVGSFFWEGLVTVLPNNNSKTPRETTLFLMSTCKVFDFECKVLTF